MNIEKFATARFGVFLPDGRFEEIDGNATDWTKHPQAHEARWVGGHHDMQLLRAVMAETVSPYITLRKLSPEDEAQLIESLKKAPWGPLIPAPHEPRVFETALRRVLDVVRRYLVPMGLSKHDALSEIIAIVDPWPTASNCADERPCLPCYLDQGACAVPLADAAALLTALRFYANGEHYVLDDDKFDTVSGEPSNWQHHADECTMVEDGSVARAALLGRPVSWVDGGEDVTPKPLEGEVPRAIAPETIPWPMRGARVDGETVVISVNGGNDAARWLCRELVQLIEAAK